MSKIKEFFQSLVKAGTIPQEPMNYDAATLKIYIDHLESENAALRKQISEMVMPPCTLGDTLYIVACTFGDGYVEDEIVHQSGFSVVKSVVTEKNFYKMCDLVRNGKAFFSQEAAERELEELAGKIKCVRMANGIEEK